jgi:hypothetical protein
MGVMMIHWAADPPIILNDMIELRACASLRENTRKCEGDMTYWRAKKWVGIYLISTQLIRGLSRLLGHHKRKFASAACSLHPYRGCRLHS